jgi:multidrug efflux pump
MGVAVFFGMLGVTAFGLAMTPVFYVALRALSGNRPLTYHGAVDAAEVAAPAPAPEHAPALEPRH